MFKKKKLIVPPQETQKVIELIDKSKDKNRNETRYRDHYNLWVYLEYIFPELKRGRWSWDMIGSQVILTRHNNKKRKDI